MAGIVNSQTLILIKSGATLDISSLLITATWTGRKGSAARSLTCTIIDDDGYHHDRSGIDVMEGDQIIFLNNGAELFRGMIMKTSQSNSKTMQFTAYDNAIYLANNSDTFSYKKKTADQIFKDVCKRMGIPTGTVAACSYVIPELVKAKSTGLDACLDAISQDYKATKKRHYIMSSKGVVNLVERKNVTVEWILETGRNIETYTYSKSIENLKTRAIAVSKEGTAVARAVNSTLEAKLGIMQEIITPEEKLKQPQIKSLVDSMLAKDSTPERSLTVKAIGVDDLIAGCAVFIMIPHINISRAFYIDEDSHTYQGSRHEMTLKLNYADDIGTGEKS